jgi:outer membrane protein assembly factor BamE (lipoprotein component of BamABCDE complex)
MEKPRQFNVNPDGEAEEESISKFDDEFRESKAKKYANATDEEREKIREHNQKKQELEDKLDKLIE